MMKYFKPKEHVVIQNFNVFISQILSRVEHMSDRVTIKWYENKKTSSSFRNKTRESKISSTSHRIM